MPRGSFVNCKGPYLLITRGYIYVLMLDMKFISHVRQVLSPILSRVQRMSENMKKRFLSRG